MGKSDVDTLRNRLVKKWHYSQDEAKTSVIEFDIQYTNELIEGGWSNTLVSKYASKNSDTVVKNGLDSIVNNQNVDIIIGGLPCQAYSVAGRATDPNSMKFDYRNYLFESYIKVVKHYKPRVIVFENVPGILSAKPSNKFIIERIYEAFDEIGYEIRSPKDLKRSIYNAQDFEVPQDRKRIIIFGVRKDDNIILENLYNELDSLKSKNKKTLKDAIFDLPKFKPLKNSHKIGNKNISHDLIGSNKIPLHTVRYANKRDMQVFQEWIKNDMNSLSLQDKIAFYKKQLVKIQTISNIEVYIGISQVQQ